MLRTRVITALVLLALIGAAAAAGSSTLLELLTLFVAVALYEWMRLAGCRQALSILCAIGYAALLLGAATVFAARVPQQATAAASLAVCVVWCGLGAAVARAGRAQFNIPSALSLLLGVVVLSVGWIALDSLLRQGIQWLVSVLAVVWIADIAAYFTGRVFGRHKLAPRVSPGKTWEGVYGALALAGVAAVAARAQWPRADLWTNHLFSALAWPLALAAVSVVVALSIVGDLFESLLKRQAQVKDSGRLLPGHGGVLDRIDATLPALPAAVLIDWWTR
jgi:phosphatidate cytidylyltransferase